MPCVLLLDTSASMAGSAIHELNAGLAIYKTSLLADSLAAARVEVAVVSFGGRVDLLSDFATADVFEPPTLVASGDTPMGGAIDRAIDMVQDRKKTYRDNGIGFYRPWIFLITDGSPTDEWHSAAARVKEGRKARPSRSSASAWKRPISRPCGGSPLASRCG